MPFLPLLLITLAVFSEAAFCVGPDAYFLGHSIQRAGGGGTTSSSATLQNSTRDTGYHSNPDSSDSYSSDEAVPILRYNSRPGGGLQNTIRNRYPVRNRQQAQHGRAATAHRRYEHSTNRPGGEPINPGFFSTMLDIQTDVPQIERPSPRYEWEQAKYSTRLAGRVLKDTICDIPATIEAARRDRQEGLLKCFDAVCNRDAVSAAYHSMTAGTMPCIRFMTAAFTTLNGCAIFLGESVCAGAHLAKLPYRMAQKRIENCQEAQRIRNELLHSIGTERYEALKAAAEKSQIDRRKICWQITPDERRALQRQHELYTEAYDEKRRHDRDLINFDPSRAFDAAGPQRARHENRATSYTNALMTHGAF